MSLDEPSMHGWDENSKPLWTDIFFPDDLKELLVDTSMNDENTDGYLSSSDDNSSDSDSTEIS